MAEIPAVYTMHYALNRLGGEFLGKTLMAREIWEACFSHWPGQTEKAVCTALSESHGRLGSYNDNQRNGVVVSRDVGLFQDNITASLIGSDTEAKLRTESRDENVWKPVLKYNVDWAYQLWATRTMFRDGKLDYRRWNPFVGYTSGWGPNPMLYVYHHDINGNAIGPWVEGARCLHAALRGGANWHHLTRQDMNSKQALDWVRTKASEWGIKEEWCKWSFNNLKGVYYIPAPAPVNPPTAEENYGYPRKNDGR